MNTPATTSNDVPFFGFWLYLMSDVLLFGALFAAYAVLHGNTFGGPSAANLFSLPYAFVETLLLLTSSFVCGLAVLAAYRNRPKLAAAALVLTLALGLSFLGMEVFEFHSFVAAGHGWQQSAFLSSFFTLVGTHGLHVAAAALWMLLLLVHLWRTGLSGKNLRRLTLLSLFWHFLDVIWIFIFTFVYLWSVL
jgi:cytochrome o ubiquinol oxidase subunit 3